MTDAPRPERRPTVTTTHIVAGAAAVAVLSGIGITAADYPWHLNARTQAPRPVTVQARQAATQVAQVVPPAPRAASPPRAAPSVSKAAAAPSGRLATQLARPPSADTGEKRRTLTRKRATKRPETVDVRYAKEIGKCKPGVAGLPCREAAKWRLCKNRWSIERRAGETRCHIGIG